ncbi:hypothetical protein X746_27245 [Mesorhizobium sp. LNJC380A00]|nr:hypothetical protein X746_27245 [Mesorhizobium sp. LNJC380A00]
MTNCYTLPLVGRVGEFALQSKARETGLGCSADPTPQAEPHVPCGSAYDPPHKGEGKMRHRLLTSLACRRQYHHASTRLLKLRFIAVMVIPPAERGAGR